MSGEQGKFAELSPDEPSKLLRDTDGVVALPKQLWSAFKEHGEGEFLCEVGWALGGGSAVTSRCVLSKDGDVKASVSDFQRTKHSCLISAEVQRLINLLSLLFVSQEIVAAYESRVSEGT